MSFNEKLEECRIDRPIFIIGHWRSGTTFLHELLCLDDRHIYPSTYACMNPHHFLLTQDRMMEVTNFPKEVKRPMDNVLVRSSSPQEDEFALLGLGASSCYEALVFPGGFMKSRLRLDPASVSIRAREKWKLKLLRFMKQTILGRSGRIVLKSPTHTARVNLLLDLFPDARFIHVVRNPYAVFPSTCSMWEKMFGTYGFNRMKEHLLEEYVIKNWLLMESCLERASGRLNSDNHHLVKYEELVDNPEAEIRRVYRFLYPDEPVAENRWRSDFLKDRKGYKMNRYPMTESRYERVRSSWGAIFEKYGYPTDS